MLSLSFKLTLGSRTLFVKHVTEDGNNLLLHKIFYCTSTAKLDNDSFKKMLVSIFIDNNAIIKLTGTLTWS